MPVSDTCHYSYWAPHLDLLKTELITFLAFTASFSSTFPLSTNKIISKLPRLGVIWVLLSPSYHQTLCKTSLNSIQFSPPPSQCKPIIFMCKAENLGSSSLPSVFPPRWSPLLPWFNYYVSQRSQTEARKTNQGKPHMSFIQFAQASMQLPNYSPTNTIVSI